MILDANAFIGKWPYWPVQKSSAQEVVAELQALRIDGAAVCSTRSVLVNWEDGNVEVEKAVSSAPGALIPFACLGTTELSHVLSEPQYDFDNYVRRGFEAFGFTRNTIATICSSRNLWTSSWKTPLVVTGQLSCHSASS
jgi:hypothetical protein